jgi:Family of unknown function (DUF6314)
VDVERSRPPAADAGGAVLRPAPNTARFLLGGWNVVREIRDHRSGETGSFRGTARLEPEPGGNAGIALSYRELGELTFGGHHGPATRSLSYRERPDGAADVRFNDGRPFYHLDLRAGHCQAEHLCGADRYLVSVRVLSDDSFAEMWRVTGPAKDYEMTTTYVRAGSQE